MSYLDRYVIITHPATFKNVHVRVTMAPLTTVQHVTTLILLNMPCRYLSLCISYQFARANLTSCHVSVTNNIHTYRMTAQKYNSDVCKLSGAVTANQQCMLYIFFAHHKYHHQMNIVIYLLPSPALATIVPGHNQYNLLEMLCKAY